MIPVKIDLNKLDREDVSLRLSAPPQALALLGTVDEDEVSAAIKRELKVPDGCSLKILGLRRSMVKALGGEALQLSSKTFYAEVCAVRGASKQELSPPPLTHTSHTNSDSPPSLTSHPSPPTPHPHFSPLIHLSLLIPP